MEYSDLPKGEWTEFPPTWEDCIVVGSVKLNKDGSLTINCQIDVQDTRENSDLSWGVVSRRIRLERQS